MNCVHAVSYILPHCAQERVESDESVVHDDEDPSVAGPLRGPEPTAPVSANGPVVGATRPLPRVPRKSTPPVQTPEPTRKRCRDHDTVDGCSTEDCQLAHIAKVICRDFNSPKGCTRSTCKHLHVVTVPSAIKTCRYQMKAGGCRQGTACTDRHLASQKVAEPLPRDLCDLRSQGQYEYVPTRDNMKVSTM